ncbi:MAG: peptide deformylase [Streptococcaceae bacterium]|jgi:peptide deformylase|nr:peptide deformylase [Streptococcaceae bacterium]
METQEKLIQEDHLITMEDIVREGNQTLRTVADDVPVPLTDEDKALGLKMLEFLHNSQDEKIAEELGLRGGVGLAANQLDIAKRIIAVLVPNPPEKDDDGEILTEDTGYALEAVLFNAKIIRESTQEAALEGGEGCLSVDREVPGFVVRHARVTVAYTDLHGQAQELRLRGFSSMCVQHEIDHTNGIMFYDHINPDDPWAIKEGMLVIQ